MSTDNEFRCPSKREGVRAAVRGGDGKATDQDTRGGRAGMKDRSSEAKESKCERAGVGSGSEESEGGDAVSEGVEFEPFSDTCESDLEGLDLALFEPKNERPPEAPAESMLPRAMVMPPLFRIQPGMFSGTTRRKLGF
ncbi:hypothetical protein J437_LFUL004337 [Ladona fulva]|uniref:Uncharacterized protein n=1 Tax=Ladona fulva TaxID=123851 RepID=A0A8K0K4J1_LADFU|nr:hypothetical protein J437_LFUL004337 [Ladona fulva]